jgi:hypothetical protein
LVLVTLMFWQGGFTFYGAVVVPVGSDILGSHAAQGWITRSVTNYLNAAGVVALLVWSWDLLAQSPRSPWGRRLAGALWAGLVLTLGLQIWLHLRLDDLLDGESLRIRDRVPFHTLHRWYLIVSTLQWASALLLLAGTLHRWRSRDAGSGNA